jgi:excisionase family DNA binding protein
MSTIQERARQNGPADMSAEEVEMARAAQRCIGESLDRAKAAVITLTSDDGDLPPVRLPTRALRLIGELLGALSERKGVTVVSAKKEMSTVDAANYLNVSRPFVIREIEAGHLPHRMVGTHRRIQFEDLYAYKQRMLANQKEALKQLAEDAIELGLDY